MRVYSRYAIPLLCLALPALPTLLLAAATERPGRVLQQEQPPASQVPTTAQEFTLSDQYNQSHRYSFPQPTVSVLVFADYDGSGQLEAWVRPIYGRYQKAIAIHGVAELSRVPGFMQGLVRTFLRDRLDYPVMLDWRGTVSKSYHYQPGQANLLVIDPQGHIALRMLGPVDAVKLQQVLNRIDGLLPRFAH